MPTTICKLLTQTELDTGVASGYYILRGGPFDSLEECEASCADTGTGTDTSPTGTGTDLDDVYYWYCLAAPPDTGTGTESFLETGTGTDSGGLYRCLLLNNSQLTMLLEASWNFGGGPYDTLEECSTFCHGLTGTGTLEYGAWYCMNEISTVTSSNCYPCQTEPLLWTFNSGSPYLPASIRLKRTHCSTWVDPDDVELSPGGMVWCPSIGLNIYMFYRVTHARFELWIQSIEGGLISGKVWMCPLEDWNCVGPNTLTGGGGSNCPELGFSPSITVYPD